MSLPITQLAFVQSERFGPLSLGDVPVALPEKGEILIKIIATALNPVDWKIAKVYGSPTYPISLGRDVAGYVVAVGEGVKEFVAGDRVFAQVAGDLDFGRAGFAQYTLLPAKLAGKIPDGISYDVAASFPVTLFGGITGLYNEYPYGLGLDLPFGEGRGKYKGVPFVVVGGSAAVRQIIIQYAKLSGFSPVITTASLKNEALLKEVGADYVINRNLPDSEVIASVKKITDKPIKHAFDAISFAETQKLGVKLLAPGGRLIMTLPAAHGELEDGKTSVYMNASSWYPQNEVLGPKFFREWSDELLRRFKPNRIEVLPGGLNGVFAGLERLEKDEVSGFKLVAHPQETV